MLSYLNTDDAEIREIIESMASFCKDLALPTEIGDNELFWDASHTPAEWLRNELSSCDLPGYMLSLLHGYGFYSLQDLVFYTRSSVALLPGFTETVMAKLDVVMQHVGVVVTDTPGAQAQIKALPRKPEENSIHPIANYEKELNARIVNSLLRNNVTTLEDLISLTGEQMHMLRGCGEGSLRLIQAFLQSHGHDFAETATRIVVPHYGLQREADNSE